MTVRCKLGLHDWIVTKTAHWKTKDESIVPPQPHEHERAVERFCERMDCRKIQHFWDKSKAKEHESEKHRIHNNGDCKWYDGPFYDVYGLYYDEIKTHIRPEDIILKKEWKKLNSTS